MSAPREADIGVDSEEQRCVAGRSTTLPHSRHSLLTAVRMHDPETEKSDEPSTAELRWPQSQSNRKVQQARLCVVAPQRSHDHGNQLRTAGIPGHRRQLHWQHN